MAAEVMALDYFRDNVPISSPGMGFVKTYLVHSIDFSSK